MLIASFTNGQFWAGVFITLLVTAMVTWLLTRIGFDRFSYRMPTRQWQQVDSSANAERHIQQVIDHHGEGPVIAEIQLNQLDTTLYFVNYKDGRLTDRLDHYLMVGEGGRIIGNRPEMKAAFGWAMNRNREPVNLLYGSPEVPDRMLDCVQHAHRYERCLQVSHAHAHLAICRKKDRSSSKPWLLVWQRDDQEPRFIHVATLDVQEATTEAVKAMFFQSNPELGCWKEAAKAA